MTQENVRELASEGRTEPKEFPTICEKLDCGEKRGEGHFKSG
jgi:hypothetical protein